MLRSGNDAALAIAHNVGGSLENFVFLMNEMASKIGMNNTVFVNPSGLEENDMADLIVGGILIAVVVAAILFIRKEKKRGVKCIGCYGSFSWFACLWITGGIFSIFISICAMAFDNNCAFITTKYLSLFTISSINYRCC